MTKRIAKVFQHILTDFDNETYDTVRVFGLVVALCGLVFQGYALYRGQTFDVMGFLTGFGGFLAGLGAGVLLDARGKGPSPVLPTKTE